MSQTTWTNKLKKEATLCPLRPRVVAIKHFNQFSPTKMESEFSASGPGSDSPPSSPHPLPLPPTTSTTSKPDSINARPLPDSHAPPSELRQNLFMIFITLTQLVQMIPLGAGINSGLAIGEALGATRIQSTWVVASYPLTQGAFVLIGGRLGAVYGHKKMLTVGGVWWILWALCGGFSNDIVAMCFMRGLCGIGGGLMIPNIIALLGITFPPGPKRNLSLALFGAMAPVGAAGGSLVAAVVIQLTEFKWLFMLL